MDYVIYRVETPKAALNGMTSNPNLDFAYFKTLSPVVRFEVLTAGMDINRAYYIMDKTNKSYSPLKRIAQRRHNNINYNLLSGLVKAAALNVNVKCLRKPVSITKGCDIPDSNEEDVLYNIVKGKLVKYSDIDKFAKNNHIFLNHNILDILQILYLKGKTDILPQFIIKGYGKKISCIYCGKEQTLKQGQLCCANCSRALDSDEPVFASPYTVSNSTAKPYIFKHMASLTLPQKNASYAMDEFIKGSRKECLMWISPDQEDISIFLNAINNVLNRGGRVLISVPCISAANSISAALSPYSNHVFADDSVLEFRDTNMDIALFRNIGCFYSSYDLIILYEPPSCTSCSLEDFRMVSMRALKPEGKLVFASSAPEYRTYKNRQSGDAYFMALPIRKDGMIFPEPRILTYKRLSESNPFIPDEVMDFIRWSNLKARGLRIISPSINGAFRIKEMLSPLNLNNVRVEIYPFTFHMSSKNENLIVFFADRREVFNEKALLNITMLPSGREKSIHQPGTPYEVLFVGAYETEEMYNARIMLRMFDKKAWEMGYIKQIGYDGKNI